MSRSGRTEDVHPEPGCNLGCAVCDCRNARSEKLDRVLALGGARLEIRGEAATQRSLADVVARAKSGGWSRIAVRTNGVAFANEARARALFDMGVDEVVFHLVSDRPKIHDAVARVRGAHASALAGLSALAKARLPIQLEVPVLSPTLQDLVATIDLAPMATALRLYSPERLWTGGGPVPRELLPPRWNEVRRALSAAIDHAERRGLEFALGERDGIPLCGALEGGEVRVLLRERAQRPMTRSATSRLGARCSTCAVSSTCPGVTDLYLQTHGDTGLEPRTTKSTGFVRTRVRPDSVWDEERRASARQAKMVVLRPTVNCNQDCWFCSANETSRNVEADPGRMTRRIVRLARAGVRHMSFSGGEPTLSKHLLHYVETARAAGVQSIELVTNAVLLDREEKVDAFVRAGVTNLFVSLHGHDEATSRSQTRKIGDHARTTRALELFAKHEGVIIRLNHVVTARNYRHLVRFVEWVSARFGTRVSISFAYITPQYKALDRLAEALPRYRDVAPFLKKALVRAAELEIECVVGSRQGVPPCTLDELAIYSDVAEISDNALAEDVPQKQKAERCKTCRFDRVCTGVWKPYAELHGLDELRPIVGEPIAPHEDLAAALGVRSLPRSEEMILEAEAPARVRLDVLQAHRLRVAVVGSGARALRLAHAAKEAGLDVVGIASPHAREKELPEIAASVSRAPSLAALLDEVAVDAVMVASATLDHAPSARVALARNLPVLVEKPLAHVRSEARALVEDAGARLTVAHQLRMSPGFQELLAEARGSRSFDLEVRRRVTPRSPEAPHTWNRSALYETLIHLGDLVIAALGTSASIVGARSVGTSRPEACELRGRSDTGRFTIFQDFDAATDELEVEAIAGARRIRWTRRGRDEELVVLDAQGARSRSPSPGSDLVTLLSAWASSIETGGAPPIRGVEGESAMRLASEALDALDAFGTPFDRAGAPRHASSSELRERYD